LLRGARGRKSPALINAQNNRKGKAKELVKKDKVKRDTSTSNAVV